MCQTHFIKHIVSYYHSCHGGLQLHLASCQKKKIYIWQQTKRLRRLLKVTSQARIAGRQRDVVLGAGGTLLGFEVDADHSLPTRALEDCLTMSWIWDP